MAGQPSSARLHSARTGNGRWSTAFWAAWLIVTALDAACIACRWASGRANPPEGWWLRLIPDWLPLLPVLLLAIPCWFMRRRLLDRPPRWWQRLGHWGGESCPTVANPVARGEEMRAVALSLLVAGVALWMSWYVGQRFGDLPPAYHDEFSYLFQARTFLAGRASFPSHPQMPELFDQMHVLNEGQFASRYFPGVGLWMAPFVALGHPWWGHWVAHSLAAFLLFWIGRHLANNAVGLLAGLLLAVSPGVALFSNLLLAHHPTLVGLLIFVITFLKLRRAIAEQTRLWPWALLSSCGLTFAMLCRPMTAAGVGLPFGLWFGWWVLTGGRTENAAHTPQRETAAASISAGSRWRTAFVMAVPIACGFAGLFFFNQAITGDGFMSPYQLYTDIYTPRHVYGFDNVVRGEQHLGPKVIENYDLWAKNLTPALAMRNVAVRLLFSLRWTLSIPLLALAGLVFLLTIDRWSGDWRLMAAAIASLHMVHIPYWFDGIMGWHYVFESAPFWLLIFAGVSHRLWQHWAHFDRPLMCLWWTGLVVTAVAANLMTIEPFWTARLDRGMSEVAFSRRKYAEFFDQMEQLTAGRRSLVLVKADPSDRHIDYVVNSPNLNGDILYGRFRPGQTDLEDVAQTFADRDVWLIDVVARRVERVSTGSDEAQERLESSGTSRP